MDCRTGRFRCSAVTGDAQRDFSRIPCGLEAGKTFNFAVFSRLVSRDIFLIFRPGAAALSPAAATKQSRPEQKRRRNSPRLRRHSRQVEQGRQLSHAILTSPQGGRVTRPVFHRRDVRGGRLRAPLVDAGVRNGRVRRSDTAVARRSRGRRVGAARPRGCPRPSLAFGGAASDTPRRS